LTGSIAVSSGRAQYESRWPILVPKRPGSFASSQASNFPGGTLEHPAPAEPQGPACHATLPHSWRAAKRLHPPSRACVRSPVFLSYSALTPWLFTSYITGAPAPLGGCI